MAKDNRWLGCNIWMICLILIWFIYGLSRMFQLPQFVWALRSSVWDLFINFLLIDATDRSKISSVQKRFFIALSLYPLSFFANTPFNNYSQGNLVTELYLNKNMEVLGVCSFLAKMYSLMLKISRKVPLITYGLKDLLKDRFCIIQILSECTDTWIIDIPDKAG